MSSVASPNANKHRKDFSKRSIASVFAIGAVMLVLPLALVVFTGPVCTQNTGCSKSTAYRVGVSFIPYLMLVGGVLIGYNMKRLSDSLKPPIEHDSADEPEQ